jgi:hypothetical protein
MDRVTGANHALGQNLRPQPPAMYQARQNAFVAQSGEMRAGFAQPQAANPDLPNLKLAPHKMIQRYAARDDVASRCGCGKLNFQFTAECFDGFALNQGQLEKVPA